MSDVDWGESEVEKRMMRLKQESVKPETCKWEKSAGFEAYHLLYKSSCKTFTFRSAFNSEYKFCPYCGKEIEV